VGKDCAERVGKGVDSNENPPVWLESCFDSAVSHQKNCLHSRNSSLGVCPQFKTCRPKGLSPFQGSVPISKGS
jgi:hypothetical protein